MAYYYCFDVDYIVSSYDNNINSVLEYPFKIGFGTEQMQIVKEYQHAQTSFYNFSRSKARFVMGNKNFKKIEIYGKVLNSQPKGIYTDFENITSWFTINIYSSAGVFDITPNDKFNYKTGSYVEMYVAIDRDFDTEKTFTYTENLTNITSNAKLEYVENSVNTVEFNSNDENVITNLVANIGEISIADNKKTATHTFTATEDIEVIGNAQKLYYFRVTGTFENCTINIVDNEIVDSINKPYVIITANEGYEFTNYFCYEKGHVTKEMIKEDTMLKASVTPDYNYLFDDNYKATKKVEKIGSFANIYFTNNDEITKLSKKRFIDMSSSGAEVFDYGVYITNLYLIPFTIPNDMLSETQNKIILGNFDTNVSSTLLKTYSLEVDGGQIVIDEKYRNAFDYLNTECILHLPYFNKMYLNNEYVIGQTITIKYMIDFYTGNVTCNVYSTFINDIVETQTQQITENIPFIQKQNNSVVGTITHINKNLIDTSFIEIVRNIPYNNDDGIFGKEVNEYGLIGSFSGYIRCQNVALTSSATVDEKEEISNILKEGVFINE